MNSHTQSVSLSVSDVGMLRLLGVARILIALMLFCTLTGPNGFLSAQLLPEGLWSPVSIAALFGSRPEIAFIQWATLSALLFTVLLGLGVFTRITGPLAFVTGWITLAIAYSFGKLNHTTNMLMMMLFIFNFSDWGHSLSVDGIWRAIRKQPARLQATAYPEWPIWLSMFTLSLFYFSSGFMKAFKGKFLVDGYVSGMIKAKAVYWELYTTIPAGLKQVCEFLIARHDLGNLAAWGTVLLELFFFTGLFSRQLRLFVLASAILFHAGIALTTKVFFAEHLVMLLLMTGLTLGLMLRDRFKAAAAILPPNLPQAAVEPTRSAWLKTGLAYLGGLGLVGVLLASPLQALSQGQWMDLFGVFDRLTAFFPDPQIYDSNADLYWSGGMMLFGLLVFIVSLALISADLLRAVRGPVADGRERFLLFDADCGFCQAWCNWSIRRGASRFVSFTPCQTADKIRSLAAIDSDECADYAIYVEMEQGRVVRVEKAAGAINAVLAILPGVLNVVFRLASLVYGLDVLREIEDRGYKWVASNRYLLSGGMCQVGQPPTATNAWSNK